VVLFSTLGALVGALINYCLAVFLGRPAIYWFADSRAGHLLMLNGAKIKKAEDYFIAHGISSTLIGRLVPVIRQLISIPAGLAKMKMVLFIAFTTLGAFIWNVILALLGYAAHGQKDLIDRYSHEISWGLLGLGILFVGYLVIKGVRKRKIAK
jgi:membrane protein DedA with SNARE-associated domain